MIVTIYHAVGVINGTGGFMGSGGGGGGVFLALQWSLGTNPRSHRSYTDLGTLKWQKSTV